MSAAYNPANSREAEKIGRANGLSRSEAVVFGYVAFWGPKGTTHAAGQIWTYTTRPDLIAELGLSERTIDRALASLETQGLVARRTDYNHRSRNRVTLLRLSDRGAQLLASKEPSRNRHADGSGPVKLSSSKPSGRRDQCRQNDATHLTDIPPSVGLKEVSEKPRNGKSPANYGVQSSNDELLRHINAVWNELNLPVWRSDKWAGRCAAQIVAVLEDRSLTVTDACDLIRKIASQWPIALRELPEAYQKYTDNLVRPSIKCVADNLPRLIRIAQDWDRLQSLNAQRAWRAKQLDEEMDRATTTAISHLLNGKWSEEFDGTLPAGAWTAAHDQAMENAEYAKRYAFRHEQKRKESLFRNTLRFLYSSRGRLPEVDENDRKIVAQAVFLQMYMNTSGFAKGWADNEFCSQDWANIMKEFGYELQPVDCNDQKYQFVEQYVNHFTLQ